MRLRYISISILAGSLALLPASVRAQSLDPQCATGSTELEDACQKAIDLFAFFTPQLGIMLGGGNPMIGSALPSAGGGLLRLSFDIRATALSASIPQFVADTPATTGAQSTDYAIEQQLVALPVATASVGVLPGFRVAGLTVLAVDALVSATVIPDITTRDLQLNVAGSPLRLGYGATIGLVGEVGLLPAVSVSYLTRALPSLDIQATTAENDSITLGALDARTEALRIVASKRAGPLNLAVGYGRDSYDVSAEMRIVINRPTFRASGTPFSFAQRMTRNNLFADAALELGAVTIATEAGMAARTAPVPTFNAFSGEHPEDARGYWAVGVRFGF